jgi:hypothetical protein
LENLQKEIQVGERFIFFEEAGHNERAKNPLFSNVVFVKYFTDDTKSDFYILDVNGSILKGVDDPMYKYKTIRFDNGIQQWTAAKYSEDYTEQ